MQVSRFARPVMVSALAGMALSACAKVDIAAPHLAPLPKEARMLLGAKRMTAKSPIFIRIFKAESELEVWKQRDDGRFHHFKTYPICNWSGGLGPKLKQGDKQAPEGFYKVPNYQMNPNSKFHLSFNLGFPNAFDKAHGRTGNFLMVHGKCRSAGCYAMTDALIEEIYALAREALAGGQKAFHVHAFPFRMTEQNLARYRGNPNIPFWRSLKAGYDYFEITRQVPNVAICNGQYHVNVEWNGGKLDPRGRCPRFTRGPVVPYAGAAQPATQPGPINNRAPASWGPATTKPAAPLSQRAAITQPRFNGRMSLGPGLASSTDKPGSIEELLRKYPN